MRIIGRSEESFSKEEREQMDDYYDVNAELSKKSNITIIVAIIILSIFVCAFVCNVYHQIATTGDFTTMVNTDDDIIKIYVSYKFKCNENIDKLMLNAYGKSHLYGNSSLSSDKVKMGIAIKRDMNNYIYKMYPNSFNYRKCAVYEVNVK